MSIFDNKNVIEITKDDINDASLSSKCIEDNRQKRAFANVLGARLGIKFLHSIDIKADNYESLYTIPAILKDMDISDINVGNIKVDVRVVPDENQLFVPKSQFEYNTTPDIYIFIKIFPDFSYAEFIGAIPPEEIDKNNGNKDYYYVDKDSLYNEKSLNNVLQKTKPQSNLNPSENDIFKAESYLVNFIDGDIMNNEKHFLYEQLTKSSELRKMFKEFEHFELISTDLAHTDEILSDSVLDVLGAQQIYKEDLSEGEFPTDIDLDEIANATVADFVEDFNDEENKDIDMLEDENIIEGEFEELPEDTDKTIEDPGHLEKLPSDEELASFADFNEFERLTSDDEDNTISLEDFNSLDTQDNGFEGFEGLEANNEDLTQNETENAQIDDTTVSPSEINLDDFNDIDALSDNFEDFSEINLDEIEDNQSLPELEELHPTEDLTSFEDVTEDTQNSEETIEELPTEEPTTMIEESGSLLDAVQQEGMNIDGVESLEQFEAPIDLTLPTLEPDADLPMLEPTEEINELHEEQTNEEAFTDATSESSSLDDIAQEVNFDEAQTEDLNLEYFQNIDAEALNADVDLSEFSDFTQDLNEQTEVQDLQEEPKLAEPNTPSDEHEEEDFSGLEEFTMDMAAAVEQANPHINNPQMAMENNTDFNSLDDNAGFTVDQPSENMDFNILDSNEQMPSSQPVNDLNPTSDINLDEFDLDSLDDFDDDDSSPAQANVANSSNIDSELDNLVNNSDFNIDDIDLDDFNINNSDINLDDLDVNLEDEQNFTDESTTALSDIPELSDDSNLYSQDMNTMQQPQNEMNDDFSQNQNDIYSEQNMEYNNEQYNPDFSSNDQQTIEQLYDDSSANQMPGDAIDQSFNQNNVNNATPKQPKPKKTSPLLGILLLVLVCALGYMKKDFIVDKFNTNKGLNYHQDQNMPLEGETQEEKEDEKLLNDNSTPDAEPDMMLDEKKEIGAIPGEAGGPQDVKSMTESLKQKVKMPESISNAFPKTPEPLSSSNLKRLYWEIPQDLTYNEAIVHYLKVAGRTMKFSIQSDLLNATELPYSNKMIVDIKINKSGEIEDTTTTVSSGSKQIDSIVLQSVKAALKYVKAPTAEFKNDSYNFSLIINF